MNILQILPSLDAGGVETGTVDLARYLARNGHRAIVISGGGKLVRELDAAGVRHYTLPVGKKSLFNIFSLAGEVARIARIEEIDIIHARSRVPALIGYIASRMTKKVFVTTAHGYYSKHFLSAVMGWGKYVIVASNIMARHMAADFGVPYERIRLIPRGVDLERFKFRNPEGHRRQGFVIGMVARITPLKGHADFIKALSILNRKIPQLKAIIVGEAPKVKYREELELLIKRLGLARTVEFTGAKQDIPEIMNKLDILVSATVTPEAFGRAIIEAQACGVPVVATRVGGVVDIIEDGINGLLSAPSDPKEMAQKITTLYEERPLWDDLARNGRRRVEESFDLDKMMTRTLAVYEEALKATNILIIKISAIGDVILSIPSLRAIRARFPDARIKVLVGVEAREILDRCPYVNDLIVCDFKKRDKGVAGLFGIAKELRNNCFDIVIDLQNNRKSHMLGFLSFAPLRYGYDNGKWSFLLNRKIKDDAPYLDPIEHQFRTLKLAGIKPQDKMLELWPSKADEEEAARFLADNWVKQSHELVGINVRASSRWLTKNWPPRSIAELCDRLAKELNIRVVLTGAKEDAQLAEEIANFTRSKPILAVGRTDLMELAALIKRFKVYVTPDSAPMHIAAALRVPFIALFGPTDPVRHVPPARELTILSKAAQLKCAPCYSPYCLKSFRCMKNITVEEVLAEIKKYLMKGAAV